MNELILGELYILKPHPTILWYKIQNSMSYVHIPENIKDSLVFIQEHRVYAGDVILFYEQNKNTNMFLFGRDIIKYTKSISYFLRHWELFSLAL